MIFYATIFAPITLLFFKKFLLAAVFAQKLLVFFVVVHRTELSDDDKKRHYLRCIAMHNSLRLAKALKTLPENALDYNDETENLSLEAAEHLQTTKISQIPKASETLEKCCVLLTSLPMVDMIVAQFAFLQFALCLAATTAILWYVATKKKDLFDACAQQSKMMFYYT